MILIGFLRFERRGAAKADIPANLCITFGKDLLHGGDVLKSSPLHADHLLWHNSHFVQIFRALKIHLINDLNKFSPFFTAPLFRGRRRIRDRAVTLRFLFGQPHSLCMQFINSFTPTVAMPDMKSDMA
jgi:hypothetical protein